MTSKPSKNCVVPEKMHAWHIEWYRSKFGTKAASFEAARQAFLDWYAVSLKAERERSRRYMANRRARRRLTAADWARIAAAAKTTSNKKGRRK